MLRRKASKIEVKIEDKEELQIQQQQQQSSHFTTPTSTATAATSSLSLLQHFDQPTSKSTRNKKWRLPDSKAHQSLSTVLSSFHKQTHFQHNVFFDGAAFELSSRRAILRRGFCHRQTVRCVPKLIGSVESRILKRVREEFGVKADENGSDGGGYVCLGGFQNVRGVYEWNSLTLELDETLFDFGTLYEVECESVEPEKAKELIEGLLKQSGIPHSYSTMSKFAIFRAGKLPE